MRGQLACANPIPFYPPIRYHGPAYFPEESTDGKEVFAGRKSLLQRKLERRQKQKKNRNESGKPNNGGERGREDLDDNDDDDIDNHNHGHSYSQHHERHRIMLRPHAHSFHARTHRERQLQLQLKLCKKYNHLLTHSHPSSLSLSPAFQSAAPLPTSVACAKLETYLAQADAHPHLRPNAVLVSGGVEMPASTGEGGVTLHYLKKVLAGLQDAAQSHKQADTLTHCATATTTTPTSINSPQNHDRDRDYDLHHHHPPEPESEQEQNSPEYNQDPDHDHDHEHQPQHPNSHHKPDHYRQKHRHHRPP